MATHRPMASWLVALVGGPALLASTALAWETRFDGGAALGDAATSVAVDRAGDVAVVGTTRHDGDSWDLGVLKLSGRDGKVRWTQGLDGTQTPGTNVGTAVAIDSSSNVVAAGVLSDSGPAFYDFGVVKLAGASGSPLWRTAIDGAGDDSFASSEVAAAVAIDGSDDVIAGGSIDDVAPGSGEFAVVKLAGASGAEVWRTIVVGSASGGLASAVVPTATGDVIAAGLVSNSDLATRSDIAVVRLAAASGVEEWRTVIAGSGNGADWATAVAIDPAGDVVVVGRLVQATTGPDFFVAKLSGATGVELWRRTFDGGGTPIRYVDDAYAVAIDAAGDVLTAGSLEQDATYHFTVIKLAGADGAERWRQVLDGSDPAVHTDSARAIAVDAAGDVLVAGGTRIGGGDNRLTVVKLTGVSGNVQWRNDVGGHAGSGQLVSLALDDAGNAVAAGDIFQLATDDDVAVLKLDEHLFGKQLDIRDNATRPSARRLTAKSTGDLFGAAPGSGGDPTTGGAVLGLLNPTSGEHAEITLPAGGWRPLARGYRYTDRSSAAICRRVDVSPTRGLKVSCKGAGISYTLDEPAQGSVAVRLKVGSAGPRYCMVFGGTVLRDVGSTTGKGSFKAAEAAAPAVCPFGSASGAFVD